MKNLVFRNQQMTDVRVVVFLVIVAGLFCSVFTGCQRDSLNLVTGTVTLDGTPIEEGAISFMPSGSSGVSAGSQIKNGVYSARVSPGKMIVKIYAERSLTEEDMKAYKANPMMQSSLTPIEEMKKQYIPENYNEKSSLTVDVQGNMKNLDFQLESK